MGPLIDNLKRDRLDAGLGLEASAPCFHSTDVYGKHRLKLTSFYSRKYPERSVEVDAPTPKADAARLVQLPHACLTEITGDPCHDVIAFRRLVSPSANDCRDLINDHSNMMARLSAPEPGELPPPPSELEADAHELLKSAVEDPLERFRRAVASGGVPLIHLREFMQQPRVADARVWKNLFGAHPPRGAIARIARRCQATRDCDWVNYPTIKAFKREMRRMAKWYRPGRRTTRWRRGIIRRAEAPEQVRGLRSAWSSKVKAHYKRLGKKLRLEGLWRWRQVALSMMEAGIPMQTGTVAVERVWASLKDMLPRGARTVSPGWFHVVSMLAFLRYNFRHYTSRNLPAWAENDSLMAQRVEALAMFAKAATDEPGVDLGHLGVMFEPFTTPASSPVLSEAPPALPSEQEQGTVPEASCEFRAIAEPVPASLFDAAIRETGWTAEQTQWSTRNIGDCGTDTVVDATHGFCFAADTRKAVQKD